MIYFAQDTVSLNIKIGYTSSADAGQRLKALQTGNSNRIELITTMPGDQAIEGALHQMFAKLNVCGEWFRPGPHLVKFLSDTARASANRDTTRVKSALDFSRSLSFYLAGKIDWGCNWRNSIVSYDLMDGQFDPLGDWPLLRGAINDKHNYVGPYYTCMGHGQSFGDDDRHGLDVTPDAVKTVKSEVVRKCLDAIQHADVLFAWIDSLDCYGTITEVGYALALDKSVWIAGPRCYRDMWFLCRAASCVRFSSDLSPDGAFEDFLANPSFWKNEVRA